MDFADLTKIVRALARNSLLKPDADDLRRRLTWGAAESYEIAVSLVGAPVNKQSFQLVRMDYPDAIPSTWTLYLWLELQNTDVGSPVVGENVIADFSINFGVGQSTVTRPFSMEIGGTGGGTILPAFVDSDNTIDQGAGIAITIGEPHIEIPAQRINIDATITCTGSGARAIVFSGRVGAFAAPRFAQ